MWTKNGRCEDVVWTTNGRCEDVVWTTNGRCEDVVWTTYGRCEYVCDGAVTCTFNNLSYISGQPDISLTDCKRQGIVVWSDKHLIDIQHNYKIKVMHRILTVNTPTGYCLIETELILNELRI